MGTNDDAVELARQVAAIDIEIYQLHARRQTIVNEINRRQWIATYAATDAIDEPAWTPPPMPSVRTSGPEWTVERIRNLLLWIGAALLAISVLTFTAVAWSHFGDGGRAVLIGLVTLLFASIAYGLRRRLPVSAEAFSALAVVTALIDCLAARRAGAFSNLSATAAWSIGALAVGTFAFGLRRSIGTRSARLAYVALLPAAFELMVARTHSQLGASAALALFAAVLVAFMRRPVDDDPIASGLMGMHAVGVWMVAAGLGGAMAGLARSFPAAIAAACVIALLAVAPIVTGRKDMHFILGGIPLGIAVTLAAQVLAWPALLAFTLAAATVQFLLIRDTRWRVTAAAYAYPGAVWAVALAIGFAFAPLAQFHHVWTDAYVRHPMAGWSLSIALVALSCAWRRTAMVFVVAAMLVQASHDALVFDIALVCTIVIADAWCDRKHIKTWFVAAAILPGISAVGWAAATRDASIASLILATVLAASAAWIATSARRHCYAALAAAAAIACAGVWTGAFALSVAAIGLAVVVSSALVLLLGVHARRMELEGVGAGGALIGLMLATTSIAVLAFALTLCVPVALAAALRRDRSVAYGVAAGIAALTATWAWLADAHVTVVEAYTVPAALIALEAGIIAWKAGPARSWLTLGPALTLALGPTVVVAIAQDDGTRTAIAALAALVIVCAGAWQRLQAPLFIGCAALVALAIDTFGPAAARLPRWLPLAIAGVLLMWIGATFERRRDGARRMTHELARFG